jgi:hypothetical protein
MNSHPLALWARDDEGGYFRVFDSKGHKVFEVFSKRFAFDVVLPEEDQVEFQLADEDNGYGNTPSESDFSMRPDTPAHLPRLPVG